MSHSSEGIIQYALILKMDPKARIEIWKRLKQSLLLPLRLTCIQIKHEIDHAVGLYLTIDSRLPSFQKFIPNVGIQELKIKRLLLEDTGGSTIKFLLHPSLLRKLKIFGEISQDYATYMFEASSYVRHLSINFTDDCQLGFKENPFPVQNSINRKDIGALPSVVSLRINSTTSNTSDFLAVQDMIVALVTIELQTASLRHIAIRINHESTYKNMHSFHLPLAQFVNHNSMTLRSLFIEIFQHQLRVSPANSYSREILEQHPGSFLSLHLNDVGEIDPSLKRTSLASIDSMIDELGQIDVTREPIHWNQFPELKLAVLITNKCGIFWLDCLTQASCLEALVLNLKIANNWPSYVKSIQASAKTLRTIEVRNVNRGNVLTITGNTEEVWIDLAIFKRCPKLYRLSLSCKEDEVIGTNYKLTGICAVRKIRKLEFGWVRLTPWQLTCILLWRYSLIKLHLSYTTTSDSQLTKYMCRCRWMLRMNLTGVKEISIVDHKIRFQSGMQSVDAFVTSQWRHSISYDGFRSKVIYSTKIHNSARAGRRVTFPTLDQEGMQNPKLEDDIL